MPAAWGTGCKRWDNQVPSGISLSQGKDGLLTGSTFCTRDCKDKLLDPMNQPIQCFRRVSRTFASYQNKACHGYLPGQITFYPEDWRKLEPTGWLNDILVNFWMVWYMVQFGLSLWLFSSHHLIVNFVSLSGRHNKTILLVLFFMSSNFFENCHETSGATVAASSAGLQIDQRTFLFKREDHLKHHKSTQVRELFFKRKSQWILTA